MIGFGRLTHLINRPRDVNMADFFRPEIVLRHIGKPPECSQPARSGNPPAGLFHHFAVQRPGCTFARIDSATGKLHVRRLTQLARQQEPPAQRQHRVSAWSHDVLLLCTRRMADPSDHTG